MSDSSAYTIAAGERRPLPFTRLDTIFASTEQALTRAEENLRRAHETRLRTTSRIRITMGLLWARAEPQSRQ